ncbi:DNA/RNA helicase domain-containing protein [Gryllotalpicola koreensis]|uniref:Schlafen group 3-like DNA/RNA helicase domain-containing protein n=1 Tax=Gryllotalpicola koreensis TaxID=993086 RepID=A0ABP8A065_9MICO
MTSFEVERLVMSPAELKVREALGGRFTNWPVVYVLNGTREVYVGESRNFVGRMRQHLASPAKKSLEVARVILDDRFNKSVCLDLEAYLTSLFAGDGRYTVLNYNDRMIDSDYYARADYRATFNEIFERLRDEKLFERSIPEIENSDLFKLSPFKQLNTGQAVAVEAILEQLFKDLATGAGSTAVIQGDPGTGKTIVGIYLLKLLQDIAMSDPDETIEADSVFSELFTEQNRELLRDVKVGLVIPQQSLRSSVKKVFRHVPALSPKMVLSPFEVGAAREKWDLLVVDETHRLSQRANQPSGMQNKQFAQINERLFGADGANRSQLDWIRAQSTHQLFLIDSAQSVRPADLPAETQRELIDVAKAGERWHPLASQMRVRAQTDPHGLDYVEYVRRMLSDSPPAPQRFDGYELRMFDSLAEMHAEIRKRDEEFGLSRLVAGYAWEWKSKNDPNAYDIELDGCRLQWNRTDKDWINSPGSIDEVGSIHTVQGYDLNYAGVIIGPDLRFDEASGRIVFDRAHYFDKKGVESNGFLGRTYSDEEVLAFVRNIYAVLLTRGIRGTYVYVADAALDGHLRHYLPYAPR